VPGSSQAGYARETSAQATSTTASSPCNEIQNIRVNVHFLQHDDGTGNFTAFSDGKPGTPGTATTGYSYAQSLIGACNNQMAASPALWLAPGSALTPIPKRVRWVLDGVFFDRNSFYRDGAGYEHIVAPLYNSPFHDYAPLCVRGESVINIFLVEEIEWPYVGPRGNNNYTRPVVPGVGIRGYVTIKHSAAVAPRRLPSGRWLPARGQNTS